MLYLYLYPPNHWVIVIDRIFSAVIFGVLQVHYCVFLYHNAVPKREWYGSASPPAEKILKGKKKKENGLGQLVVVDKDAILHVINAGVGRKIKWRGTTNAERKE